jgi:O-antigen/teichoic acid export membrane protein
MPLLYVYASVLSLGFITPLVASALDAMGRPSVILKLSLGWVTLAWIGVLYATPRWGMLGFALGYSVHVIVGNLIVLYVAKLLVPEAKLISRLWAPAIGAAVTALLGRHFMADHITNIGGVILGALACLLVYSATVIALDRTMLKAVLSLIPSRST